MSVSEYGVVFEQAGDGGWSAYVLDVPGVIAAGDTRAVAAANMRQALRIYGEELARQGQEMPRPRSEVGVVSV